MSWEADLWSRVLSGRNAERSLVEAAEAELAGAALSAGNPGFGQDRFRPILLSSLTTFVGLSPLLLEQSLQAQFLFPWRHDAEGHRGSRAILDKLWL